MFFLLEPGVSGQHFVTTHFADVVEVSVIRVHPLGNVNVKILSQSIQKLTTCFTLRKVVETAVPAWLPTQEYGFHISFQRSLVIKAFRQYGDDVRCPLRLVF